MEFRISVHAKEQIEERGIPAIMVLDVANSPAQKFDNDIDETVCQSKVIFEEKEYLLRVFVNFIKTPPVIISVYRTSKISKFWRE